MNKKEIEKILKSFKDKGLEHEQIIVFTNNGSYIQEILNKFNKIKNKKISTKKNLIQKINWNL